MEKILRIILMAVLLLSLVVVTFFIIFCSFVEMFNLNLKDTLAILSSIFSFLGIVIAASVAIYVMNKNHKDGDEKEKRKQEALDAIQFRKAVERVQEAVLLSGSHYDAMKSISIGSTMGAVTPLLLKQFEEIEINLKDNKNLQFYDEMMYIKILTVSKSMLEQIFVFNLFLTTTNKIMLLQQDRVIKESLKNITDIGTTFLDKENFKVIKFEEIIK